MPRRVTGGAGREVVRNSGEAPWHPKGWRRASRLMARSPTERRLVCDSCSSGRSFAYSFLQTPPRDDALAVRSGVPAIKAPKGLAPPSQTPCLAHHKKKGHQW